MSSSGHNTVHRGVADQDVDLAVMRVVPAISASTSSRREMFAGDDMGFAA